MALTAEDTHHAANPGTTVPDVRTAESVNAGRQRSLRSLRRDTWSMIVIGVMAAIGVAGSIVHARRSAAELGACIPQFGSGDVWEGANLAGGPGWVLSSAGASGGGRAQVADSGSARYEASLSSPSFIVPAHGADIEFHQRRAYSWANTMGVIEVAIDDGPFEDIAAAGGTFSAGAYDGRSLAGNPLGFRSAWGAAPDTDTLTRFTLPPAANGKPVRLRFRIGSAGTGDALPGWSLDDIHCLLDE
jgi:hypothetical protein